MQNLNALSRIDIRSGCVRVIDNANRGDFSDRLSPIRARSAGSNPELIAAARDRVARIITSAYS